MKKRELREFIERYLPDVLCLQEVKWSMAKFLQRHDMREFLLSRGYKVILWSHCKYNVGYSGTAIISKLAICAHGTGGAPFEEEGRLLWADFGGTIVVNVYSPNSGKPGELKSLDKRMAYENQLQKTITRLQRKKPVLVIGDFNVAPRVDDVYSPLFREMWLDHPSCTMQEKTAFTQLCTDNHLLDLQAHAKIQGFTFWRNPAMKRVNQGMRVDLALAPPDWVAQGVIHSFRIFRSPTTSDHAAIAFNACPSLFSAQPEHIPSEAKLEQDGDGARGEQVSSALTSSDPLALEREARIAEDVIPGKLWDPGKIQMLIDELDDYRCIYQPMLFDDDLEESGVYRARPSAFLSPTALAHFDREQSGLIDLKHWSAVLDQKYAAANLYSVKYIDDAQYSDPTSCECIDNSDEDEDEAAYHQTRGPIILPSVKLAFRRRGSSRLANKVEALVDSGASSSLLARDYAIQLLGEAELNRKLYTSGYMPTFKTADGRFTSPLGQLNLVFYINGTLFRHTFYVLPACAQNVILGGDFFAKVQCKIDYGPRPHIVFTNEVGEQVQSTFEIRRPTACSATSVAPLRSTLSCTIPPDSSMRIEGQADEADQRFVENRFGYVLRPQGSPRIHMPNACTKLDGLRTPLVVTNFSRTQFLRITKGQVVANFVPASSDDVSMYPIDLTKLGTDDDCFVDLATMCEDRAAERERHHLAALAPTSSAEYLQPHWPTFVDSPDDRRLCTGSEGKVGWREPQYSRFHHVDAGSTPPALTQRHVAEATSVASKPIVAEATSVASKSIVAEATSVASKSNVVEATSVASKFHVAEATSVASKLHATGAALVASTPTAHPSSKSTEGTEGGEVTTQTLGTRAAHATEIAHRRAEGAAPGVPKSDIHLPLIPVDVVNRMSSEEIETAMLEGPMSKIIISPHLLPEQSLQIKKFILSNRDCFAIDESKSGLVNVPPMTIDTGDALPKAFPLRSEMPQVRPVVQKHIDEMLRYGIIRHSESPWGAALLVIPKKQTGEWRIICDLRLLNEVTKKFVYPMPRVDDTLASLGSSRYFSVADAQAAFYQIPIAEEDKHKTAFRCSQGLFEYNVLPFGATNAAGFFQRMMDTALGSLRYQCAMAFIDDVIIHSATFDQHIIDLQRVFAQFRKIGLHLKARKCEFARPSISYLGHVVSATGVAPDPLKCASITEVMPKTRKELRGLVGLCSYFRRFVKNFATLMEPLTKFLNSKSPYLGPTPEMAIAIAKVKKILTSSPILCHPNFDLPFEMHTDASPHSIGATLCQRVNGMERVIMFASRALRKHELNYHHYEKEALAIVWATAVFRPYVLGTKFKVITDNVACTKLFAKNANNRLMRWVMSLQEFDIEFAHRKGSQHLDADGLSRMGAPDVDYGKHTFIEALACYNDPTAVLHHQERLADPASYRCPVCRSQGPCLCVVTPPDHVRSPLDCSTALPVSLLAFIGDEQDLPTIPEIETAQREDPRLAKLIDKLLPHCDPNGDSTTMYPALPKGPDQGQYFL
jgi:exodeoxyribonuclease III